MALECLSFYLSISLSLISYRFGWRSRKSMPTLILMGKLRSWNGSLKCVVKNISHLYGNEWYQMFLHAYALIMAFRFVLGCQEYKHRWEMNEIPCRVDHLPNDYMPLAKQDSEREWEREILFVSIETTHFRNREKSFIYLWWCVCVVLNFSYVANK